MTSASNQSALPLGSNDTIPVKPEEFGVWAEGVKRFFGKKQVLFDMRMALPRGRIFGLLGPSGCGKTTFLNCILGALRVDSGNLLVLGHPPNTPGHTVPGPDIGYMPQELALIDEFTVEELLKFYADLNNVSTRDFEERKEFLIDFLELPRDNRQISTFSGGQKRRASLAATLIHNPALVLLDEPTVGVDPTLRAKIWVYLRKLAARGTTIIITTHYIEEARQADVVGFVRQGRMLEQGPPDILIAKYSKPTLEDVFLHLCNQRDRSLVMASGTDDAEEAEAKLAAESAVVTGVSVNMSDQPPPLLEISLEQGDSIQWEEARVIVNTKPGTQGLDVPQSPTVQFAQHASDLNFDASHMGHTDNEISVPVEDVPCCKHFGPRRNKTKAMLWKNYKKLIRNYAFLIFQFLLPAIQVTLFCLAIGKPPRDLGFGVIYGTANDATALKFMDYTKNQGHLNLHSYATTQAAVKATRAGRIWGYISFPEGFSEAFAKRYTSPDKADEETLIKSTPVYRLDMTNQQIATAIQGAIQYGFKRTLLDIVPEEPAAAINVKQESAIYGSNNPRFTDFVAPGIIITMAFSQAIGLTSLGFVIDKKTGNFDRLYAAGVTSGEIMVTQTAVMMILIFIQLVLLLVVGIPIFSLPMEGSVVLVVVIAMFLGMVGMMFGLVIAAASEDEETANQLVLGTFFPSLLLSGIIWPVEAVPVPLNYVSKALPTTWAAAAMRSVMTRGWGLNNEEIWITFAVLSGWTLLLFWFSAKNLARVK